MTISAAENIVNFVQFLINIKEFLIAIVVIIGMVIWSYNKFLKKLKQDLNLQNVEKSEPVKDSQVGISEVQNQIEDLHNQLSEFSKPSKVIKLKDLKIEVGMNGVVDLDSVLKELRKDGTVEIDKVEIVGGMNCIIKDKLTSSESLKEERKSKFKTEVKPSQKHPDFSRLPTLLEEDLKVKFGDWRVNRHR